MEEDKLVNRKLLNLLTTYKTSKTEVKTKLTGDSPKDLFDELFGDKK